MNTYILRKKINKYIRRRLSSAVNNVILRCNGKVNIGKKTHLYGKLFIENFGTITIGDNIIINSGIWANPIGLGVCSILRTSNEGSIYIGNNCGLSNCSIVSEGEGVIIEDDVRIGGGTCIYDTDFHPLIAKYRYGTEKNDNMIQKKRVTIKQGAFIGAGVVILKGSTIGEKAVIGAGSVVSGDIPANEIWAGNPARRIKGL